MAVRSKESTRRTERSRSPRKREEPEEDPDERYERLRLERQLRDKEQAYQEVFSLDVCWNMSCMCKLDVCNSNVN